MSESKSLTDAEKQINKSLLTHLLRIRDELMLIDPRNLSLEEHIQWNEQVYQTGLAISKVEGAILKSISESYAAELPAIESATKKLAEDLYSLTRANEVITTVASSIGIIASILRLLS